MNDQNALLAALQFQQMAGVDTTVGEVPLDRFADSAAMFRLPPSSQTLENSSAGSSSAGSSRADTSRAEFSRTETQRANVPRAETKQPLTAFEPGAPLVGGAMAGLPHAQTAAKAAQSIPDLVRAIENFEHCELKKTARSTVVLDGNPAAPVLLVGEAPGAQEDAQGLPFVGPAGELLNKMLGAIGLKRDTHVLISNSVFWRPLGNRTPNDGELSVCRPFVARLIELNQPKLIVTLGAAATKSLLDVAGITRARGRWVTYKGEDGAEIPAMPMLHPAYLLRAPTTKREAWIDLRSLKAKMEEVL